MLARVNAQMTQIRRDLINADGKSWKKPPNHQFGMAVVPGEPHLVYISVRHELATDPTTVVMNTAGALEVIGALVASLGVSMRTPAPVGGPDPRAG